jgi:extracellular elastinolytic metalloproteinase
MLRRRNSTVALLACLFVAAASTVAAQDALIDLSAKGARKTRAELGARLAPPATTRADAVRSFLRGRHDDATLAELVETRDHDFGGVGHASFGQRVAGLDVYGTYVKASFAASGDLVSVVENLVSTSRALRPSQVGPDAALRAVLARYYPGAAADLREVETVGNVSRFERRNAFLEAPTVTRVAVPIHGAVLDSGYLVETWDRNNVLRHTLVSGRGQVLNEQLRTNTDTYRIFPKDPGATSQTLVTGPAPSPVSPNGWLGTSTTTTGNNVDAYLDRDNNDLPDSGGRPVSSTQQFDYLWNSSLAPTDVTNQRVAVTNLFYLNNILHDRLYGYGFTEGAGNFQTDNFGRGGAFAFGNDPVNAEAQDGGGSNNANFATPGDGIRPRMQMYLWTTTSPNRDGDLDSDIVYHEYGHGLTWRMIGDMSGAFGGAIGEGMSDTLAIYFNGDDKVGEYSTNNYTRGIRTAPYTGYTRTYGDYGSAGSVHFNGEIYAATMWRLRQLWLAKGWDTEWLLRYIVDGMNHTPSRPAFEDMRDGILSSIVALNPGADTLERRCTVWEAFAQFGVGVGANGNEVPLTITESFIKPAECSVQPPTGITLTAQGFKQKGVRKANLSWSGAPGAVDIYRNNVFVTTDAASPFTDTIPGKGGGSFTYRVCNAGTSVCSNNATVTF